MTETNIALPRMRTINEAANELHKSDPACAITAHRLRMFCRQGAGFTAKIGQKYYINLDMLFQALADGSWAS